MSLLACLENPPANTNPPKPYSVIVPNTETATKGETRRCGFDYCHHGPVLALRGCRTSYEAFRHGVHLSPEGPCLGHREVDSKGNASPYIFQTYLEVEERVDHLASGLEHENLMPANPDGMKLLGIYSRNRPEWVITEHAAFAHSGITVPLYDTLGSETVEYVVMQTGLTTIFCGSVIELRKLEAVARGGKCPTLTAVVVMDAIPEDARRQALSAGLKVYHILEVEEIGKGYPAHHRPPAGDDVATFCYTSGTTGEPKGALITHSNLISDAAAGVMMTDGAFSADAAIDMYFSYLPLPHIFERQVMVMMMAAGTPIGFFRGNTLLLVEDMIALKPTIMPVVPRVLNRFHDKITGGMLAAGGAKTKLFVRACKAKVAGLHKGQSTHALWDALIFNKIKAALGMGRMRFLVTGSAPIATHVLTFTRILLGCPVVEGYGQTETTAGATLTQLGDYSTGHVGGPFPCNEICLMDVPEMGYLHTDTWHGKDPRTRSGGGGEGGGSVGGGMPCQGRGEICFRGTNVFKGYYKLPNKTTEAIDEDGWLHSGDIGLWTASGALKIIDRKKNIFKLAQGEYIAPEKIENIHVQSPLIAQSFVYGDSLQNYLVAIIVPDEDAAKLWAQKNISGGGGGDSSSSLSFEQICTNGKFMDAVMEELRQCAQRVMLQGFEQVRAIHLEHMLFSPENNILTPTLKLKRTEAREKYLPVIDALYAKINSQSKL